MELEIEVFWHNDETSVANDTGIDYSILECDTKKVTFYNIDTLSHHEDEISKEWFGKINVSGSEYITTKSYEEIKQLIHDAKSTFQKRTDKNTVR